MNETLKNLIERRSIKKYKNDKIDTGLLNQILEAGTYAAMVEEFRVHPLLPYRMLSL